MGELAKIKSCCTVLGLIDIPTEKDLKKARNKLLQKWHPDKVERQTAEVRENANKKTKEINEAYEYLKGKDLSRYSPISEWTSSKTNTHSWKSEKQHEPPAYRETPKQDFPDSDVYEVFLKSSYAPSAGYNESTNTMYIRFVWGSVCRYSNVPERIFEGLIDSYSKYNFIKNNITDKFKWEESFEPFYPYKGGEQGLAREKKKEQERVNRRIKRNNGIGKMIEFLFSKPSPRDIEQFVNNPTFSKVYIEQLRMFTKHFNESVYFTKHINKEWNYVTKQNPDLFDKVVSILKAEKNRGVIIKKDEKILYFNRSNIFQTMQAGTWTKDGQWSSN